MRIDKYDFEGPYSINDAFNNIAGVYVIYTKQKCLDVGETSELKNRIAEHERKPCWKRNANGNPINLAFRKVQRQKERLELESYLRDVLKPSCGDK
jgi:predicted GIY-YIG superfamily endonuclease